MSDVIFGHADKHN